MLSSESLIDTTLARFPDLAPENLELVPIEKGGSDRWFYRLRVGGTRALIVMHYGTARAENRLYVPAARFLAEIGIRVPRILAHDDLERCVWLEDLGDRDLWSHRHDPWPELEPLYLDALEQAFRLHTRAHRELDEGTVPLNPPFDTDLYRWEQHYFFEHCIDGHFGIPEREWIALRDGALLGEIRERLAGLPRALIHRDFQSQNLMVANGRVFVIDFQGLRFGLPQYDLASLLFDPYAPPSPDRRARLLGLYREWWLDAGLDGDGFEEVFRLCALQRLMQALGAYGFLGHVRGRTWFLAHIPAARALLREVAGGLAGMEPLCDLLDNLPDRPL